MTALSWVVGTAVKHRRSKKNRGLVTRVIVYRDGARPEERTRDVTVDVRRDEIVDTDHAVAMVAVRTGTALNNVRIVEIRDQ